MKINTTPIPGLLLIETSRHGDDRGFFVEVFRANELVDAGVRAPFVQDNHSRSRRGVLRGLHYQLTQPQGKLVRVATGRVFDVAVDIRRGSPTFGQSFGVELNDHDMTMVYVPPGLAHGFAVLSESADLLYKCTDYYHPNSERGIAWNDPALHIDWPETEVTLSEKDRQLPRLADVLEAELPVYLD